MSIASNPMWPLKPVDRGLKHKDYSVGWICALPKEKTAARNMLDEVHISPLQPSSDKNIYTLGRIQGHNIVLTCLGDMGIVPAAIVAARMDSTFPALRFALMVGIAGGIPDQEDIRLGDVVISKPDGYSGGIVDFNRGTISERGLESRPYLNGIPEVLRNAISEMRSLHSDEDSKMKAYISDAIARNPRFTAFAHPVGIEDLLFDGSYQHLDDQDMTCAKCDKSMVLQRGIRSVDGPAVHYGTIASGNQVVKTVSERTRIHTEYKGALAIEMESSGLMNVFGCAVIRGICDYADTHSHKQWQEYAAVNAAALAKEVLSIVPVQEQAQDVNEPSPERLKLSQWLLAQDPSTNHAAAYQKREPATGLWFLRGQHYADWKAGSSWLLWLYGIPGCGKTILCSIIIEDLSDYTTENGSTVLLYYYFDYNDAGKRTVDSLLRSLITQFLDKSVENIQRLLRLYSQCRDGKLEPTLEQLTQVLYDFLQGTEETLLIIDALDECSECEELPAFFEKLRSWDLPGLKLIFASRQHFEGNAFLEELDTMKILVHDQTVNPDIGKCILERLRKDRKLRGWPQELKDTIYNVLMAQSCGMFRWVVCQMDALCKCRSRQDVKTALSSLPKTLDETYERILNTISESDKQDVKSVLQSLAFSQRSLSLKEVSEVIAVDMDKMEVDPDRRLIVPRDILSMCSSLVTLVDNNNSDVHDEPLPRTVVSLAHTTVRQYLLSDRISGTSARFYGLEVTTAHMQMAKLCLIYLRSSAFRSGHRGYGFIRRQLEAWPLLNYAAHFTGHHLKATEHVVDQCIAGLVHELFATSTQPYGGNFGTLVGVVWRDAPFQLLQTTKPLYFAASYGLTSIVQLLIQVDHDLDLEAKGGHFGSSPLQVASFRDHGAVVELLLKAGADPNSSNMINETSLYWAVKLGFHDIQQMLISYGAIM